MGIIFRMHRSNRTPGFVTVKNLEFFPGRHSFHFEPDFCGQMNVVLDERAPDHVGFESDTELVVDEIYTVVTPDGQRYRVRIIRSAGKRYWAAVIDA